MLDLFGVVVTVATLVAYALEPYYRWGYLAFAVTCLLMAAYCFIQGAWPVGVGEVVWAGIAYKHWLKAAP